MILVGGTTSIYSSMTYTPSGPNSGTIALGTTGGPVDITYSHLTPILDTFAVPTTYNASAATPDTLNLIDQGTLATGSFAVAARRDDDLATRITPAACSKPFTLHRSRASLCKARARSILTTSTTRIPVRASAPCT